MDSDEVRVRPARGARLGVWAAIAAAISAAAAGPAAADVLVPLPDGQETAPGATLTRTGEHAVVSPSMAANGAGRVVWVSGTVTAEVTDTPTVERPGPYSTPENWPGTNNSSTHGASQVSTGYIVGCQVSIGDSAISAGLSGNVSTNGGGVGGSAGIQIGPGQVKFVQVGFKDILRPGIYSLGYRDFEIEIQGCGGYAQARAYTVVEIIGDHYSKTTLYGAPFSIG
ncbi:MspA [Nocardia farcinica]|uniref:MspA family porin n=1 Tax=Nocardia TaxID=1817 RepID=UPI000BEF31F3|nr:MULTISPECIES: MspA family porin [Nocardia]PEH76256.1 mspA family protein [Nocardia sp. FDAARGOS_372]SUE27929.1 MspA [Nocardia farcinica]